jgi:hypothetical protein
MQMKKYLFILFAAAAIASCKKGEDFRGNKFPGFTGAGDNATWLVYRHTVTDVPYVTGVLPMQVPPTTYFKFDSTYTASRQKEVSPFSYKFFKNGEIAVITKNAQNQGVWTAQPTLKWELLNGNAEISRNTGSGWVSVATGQADEEKMAVKFRKSFFGDITADKSRYVMEVYYTIFN